MAKRKFIRRSSVLLKLALLACFVSTTIIGFAQSVTNEGKEFWVGYGHHQYMEPSSCAADALPGPNDMNMKIYLSNTKSQTATVKLTIYKSGLANVPTTWFTRVYTILPNTVIETENMPKGSINATASGSDQNFDARLFTVAPPAGTGGEGIFQKKGIHIESNMPIVAYAHIYGGVSSGATMLIPIEAWGYAYTSINSEQGGGVTGCYSWMYVIAKDSNTVVEITPSQITRLGKPANTPFQITLQKGEIYQLIGNSDCTTGSGVQLTGTKVRSISNGLGDCKPIAVFSGSSRTGGEAAFCGSSGRDNDMQQCYPQQAWGKRYLTAPFSKSSGGVLQANQLQNNVFKIAVKDPSTLVKRNGVSLSTIAPSITISTPVASICPGTSITFTAIPRYGGTTPLFQWRVNGASVGTNSSSNTYTSSTLVNGDIVSCVLTSNVSCASTTTANSNNIPITVGNSVVPAIAIFATAESLCGSNPIVFAATTNNGGTTPSYQWKLNGANVGNNSNTYSLATVAIGDAVNCIMTSNAGCLSTTTATSNTVLLNANSTITPAVTIVADAAIVCNGGAITFSATPTNGGSTPTYQWKINAVNAGSNNSIFTTTALIFGDVVNCVLTSSAACASISTATSNSIAPTVGNTNTTSATVFASSESLCGNSAILFTAIPKNGGSAPTYQWRINGINSGAPTSSNTFSASALKNGDYVNCVITSNAGCLSSATGNSNSVGMATPGLINNAYYAYTSNTGDYIEADKAVMVAQFMSNGSNCNTGDGDPEMVFLSPIEQGITKVGFYRTDLQNIRSNYITLIVPTGGVPSLSIDNSTVFNYVYPHPNKPGYTIVVKGWTAAKAQCLVSCDSPFTAITYGMGGAESYGYNAGANLNNIDGLPAFHNLPDTSGPSVIHPYTYVNTPVQIGANVVFKPAQMIWKVSAIGCPIITPCADVTINNPVPTDSSIIGSAKYYLFRLPGTYTFSQPGTYYLPIDLISPNLDNGNCNNKETVQIEIIVKYKPSAVFTSSQLIGCGVDSVHFQSPSITPELYPVIKWKWQFTSNPADTSIQQNPVFYFPIAGTYPIKLSITTLYGGIADTTININVSAGSQPNSKFGANPQTVCLGQAIVFSDSTNYSGTTGWYWDFDNTQTVVASTNANQTITYSAAGTYIVKHTLQGSFSCPADTVSKTVFVAITPTISSDSTHSPSNCSGAQDGSIFLNGLAPNTPYIVRYTFNSVVNSATATANAMGVISLNNLAAGTYSNITASIGNCTSAAVGPLTITNPSAPAAPTAASNTPICAGGQLNLTSTPFLTGGNYAWTGSNGFTSALPNPSISNAGTAASGTYTVTVTLNGCTSAAGSVTVSVNAVPAIGSTSSANPTTCGTATGSITLNALLSNTAYTVKYTLNSVVQTSTITSNASGAVVIPNLVAGTYSSITVALGTCTSNAVGPFSLSDPNPPATPTASVLTSPICAGNTINLSATSSTSGTSFEWSGPNSYSAIGASQAITNATTSATGNYTVVAKLNGCTSLPSAPINVIVNGAPAAPNTGSNSPICAGTTLNLNSSGVTGTAIYNWTGPNSFTSSSSNPSITNATVAATGTYNLTVTQNGCTSPSASPLTVTANAVPAIGTTSTINPTTCATATGTITLNGLVASTTYTVNYSTSTGVQTSTITSNASGSIIITNLIAGTYSNVNVALNNCTSSSVGPFNLSDPNPPATPVATSNTPVCSGGDLNLNAISATVGVTYTWTGPNSFTSPLQNPTISNVATIASGIYSVTSTLNSCTSAAGTTTILIKATPVITSSSSTNPTNCATATGSILLNGLLPNTSYTISYTKNNASQIAGLTSNAGGTIAINNLTAATYASIVVTLNGCSSVAVGPFTLSDPNPPATPVATSNSPLCNGSDLNLTGSSSTVGVTYNWTGPNGFTSSSPNPSIPNASSAATGTYNITATLNSCTSAAGSVAVVVNATPNINGFSSSNPTNCNSSTGSITLNGLSANTSYNIKYNKNSITQTGTTSSNSSGSVTIASLAAGTYDSISVTIGNCPSNMVGPIILTDPSAPAIPVITGIQNLCEGTTLNLIANSTTANVTYAWTSTNGFTVSGNTVNIPNTTTANNGTYTVVATVNNCSSSNSKMVTVNPVPVANFALPTFVCMPNGVANFTNQSTIVGGSAITYVWDFGDGSTNSTSTDASHTYASINSYPVKLTATSNGCSNSISKPFNAFFDKPIAAFKVFPDTLCQGVRNTFTDESSAPNSTIQSWNWNFGDNSLPSSLTNPTKLYSQPGSYDISLVVKNAQGCSSDVLIKTVKVYLQPVIDAGMSFIVPQGTTVQFSPTINDSTNVTYAWTPAADFVHPDSLRPFLVVNKNQKYKVTATGEGNCTASDTLSVVALKTLIIPNAFSPNGDNINDKWEIGNLADYSYATVEIFNRNGQLVFKSYGYSYPWNGTYNGKSLPVGTYYYIIDFKNAFPKQSGYVVILR